MGDFIKTFLKLANGVTVYISILQSYQRLFLISKEKMLYHSIDVVMLLLTLRCLFHVLQVNADRGTDEVFQDISGLIGSTFFERKETSSPKSGMLKFFVSVH